MNQEVYCSECGRKIEKIEKFCPYCGAQNELYAIDAYEQLVSEFLDGNTSAYDELYKKTYNIAWKIATSFFPGDVEECQDCIQEIYLNLYEKVRLFDSGL